MVKVLPKLAFPGQLCNTLDMMYSSRSTSSAKVIFPDKYIAIILEQLENIKLVDTTNNKISTCVDPKDSALGLLVWEWKLNFPGNLGQLGKPCCIGQVKYLITTGLQHYSAIHLTLTTFKDHKIITYQSCQAWSGQDQGSQSYWLPWSPEIIILLCMYRWSYLIILVKAIKWSDWFNVLI